MKQLILSFIFAASIAWLASAESPDAATYQIRNVKYGDLLRPRDANSADGTPIVLYPAQPWKCMSWRLQPAGESFQLRNLFTSKTFAASADTNAPQRFVTQMPFPKASGEAPSWRFTKLADGNYRITAAESGDALTAVKSEGGYEARIVVAPWQNKEAQKWHLEKIDPKDLTM